MRKHGRFQLWASGVLLSLSLCHSILSLATDSWIENRNDQSDVVAGKQHVQWILLSIGCLCGLVAYAVLICRFFGWRLAVRPGSTLTPS